MHVLAIGLCGNAYCFDHRGDPGRPPDQAQTIQVLAEYGWMTGPANPAFDWSCKYPAV
jgi:hypothetical protein